jgi:hypothetical protein
MLLLHMVMEVVLKVWEEIRHDMLLYYWRMGIRR